MSNNSDGDVFLIRIRRAGGSITLAAPTVAVDKRFKFGTYVQGSTTPVKGTIQFTGTLTIAAAGQFQLDPKASVQFEDVTLSAGSRTVPFFYVADKSEERIAITDTLTIPKGESVQLPVLVVSRSFTVKGGQKAEKTSELRVGGELSTGGNPIGTPLKVHRGASLRIDGVDLVVHLRKEILVEGTIEDVTKGTSHPIQIALLNKSTGSNRRNNDEFRESSSYQPMSQGFDEKDCKRIRGTGTIQSGILVIAMGNVCVELMRVGPVTVSGSLQNDVYTDVKISTDLIFREDVIVDGDVMQWNDSRIVFAKKATIRGDVILRDGGTPYTNTADYGQANTAADSGIRVGWQDVLNNRRYTCEYLNRWRRTYVAGDGGLRTDHIPGVHFAGMATITGDLNVYSNTLTETTTGATADATQCAPRVLFMAPLAQNKGATEIALTSSIGGSLVVEDTASFGGKGRVYLDTDSLKTGAVVRKTTHTLRVGGDLAAGGKTIGMEYPATSDGMCTGNEGSLLFGNHLVLTDAAESVIIGDATNGLTLDALVTLGDLRVESGKGPLTVKTLHVGPRAELMANKDVKVTESLLLQGQLAGELVDLSAILLHSFSVDVGNGELALDFVVKTKNLGLCSGTLSLVDVESTTDSTLHVTEQITVQNGMLEKDTNDPGSLSTDIAKSPTVHDRYILKYVTPGPRTVTNALEWFAPRDMIVDHAKAEIMAGGDRSLPGKLTITKGKLIVDGDLTVGTSSLHRTASSDTDRDALTQVNRYSVVVTAGELHTENMVVHGRVTVSGKSKLMTSDGDLHMLGRVNDGEYVHATAEMRVEKDAMADLGAGTLMLGPEDTKKRNGITFSTNPYTKLFLHGTLNGNIYVPKGSKYTDIFHARKLDTVTFDGTRTPKASGTAENTAGILRFLGPSDSDVELVIDSLSAMEGIVIMNGKQVTIKSDVTLGSATFSTYGAKIVFEGDLTLHDMGGLRVRSSREHHVEIRGNFTQKRRNMGSSVAVGMTLRPKTTKTVMGTYMVEDSVRYELETSPTAIPQLVLHGDFHFAKAGMLHAKIAFRGEERQEVMTAAKTELDTVVVDNPKGITLKSNITQQKDAALILRRGKVYSDSTKVYTWTVQNVDVERELRGRLSAQTGSKCGADNDEKCKATILRGSRQSHMASVPVVRHMLQGTAGAGFASGGYLFPVGMEKGDMSHYRPLILQLPSDLNDTTAVTVSPIMVPEGAMPAWQNLTVPAAGGNLTLDVYAPIFWKIDLGEELPTNTNLRVVADGIRNVTDVTGLRLVQWDCNWENPKLAGRVPAQADASSFAVNGYLSGVVNLTQEGIGLGSCAIFGIAANGIENPIDQADLSGGRANLQFIHNLPLPTPAEVHLGEVRIRSSLRFREATAYRPVEAGSHLLKIQAAGVPTEQAITSTLTLEHDRNYAVIAHGSLAEPKLKVLEMRMTSSVATKAEVRLVHGSADLGPAQVQVMDSNDPTMPVMTLAGNLMLDEATRRYIALDPLVQVMQVKSTDGEVEEFYELDLSGYGGQTLVINLSGTKRDLTMLGVDRNGKIVPIQTVTGAENEMAKLPAEFTLHGNYPNPFNPSTRIQFDLPENAQVQIQIVDMLGRKVITLPAQEFEAGANRSAELNAGSLASGTYLYRIMATGAEQRHVKTGRMMLVK